MKSTEKYLHSPTCRRLNSKTFTFKIFIAFNGKMSEGCKLLSSTVRPVMVISGFGRLLKLKLYLSYFYFFRYISEGVDFLEHLGNHGVAESTLSMYDMEEDSQSDETKKVCLIMRITFNYC